MSICPCFIVSNYCKVGLGCSLFCIYTSLQVLSISWLLVLPQIVKHLSTHLQHRPRSLTPDFYHQMPAQYLQEAVSIIPTKTPTFMYHPEPPPPSSLSRKMATTSPFLTFGRRKMRMETVPISQGCCRDEMISACHEPGIMPSMELLH